jgi:hypothetical protein
MVHRCCKNSAYELLAVIFQNLLTGFPELLTVALQARKDA